MFPERLDNARHAWTTDGPERLYPPVEVAFPDDQLATTEAVRRERLRGSRGDVRQERLTGHAGVVGQGAQRHEGIERRRVDDPLDDDALGSDLVLTSHVFDISGMRTSSI